jgi:predicted RNA-binding Zn-ribbon protein involved in translation (DUF1610 family)
MTEPGAAQPTRVTSTCPACSADIVTDPNYVLWCENCADSEIYRDADTIAGYFEK